MLPFYPQGWPWPSVRRPRVYDAAGESESSFIRLRHTDPPEAPRSAECQPRLEGAKSLVGQMAALELGLWGRVRAVGKSLNPLHCHDLSLSTRCVLMSLILCNFHGHSAGHRPEDPSCRCEHQGARSSEAQHSRQVVLRSSCPLRPTTQWALSLLISFRVALSSVEPSGRAYYVPGLCWAREMHADRVQTPPP